MYKVLCDGVEKEFANLALALDYAKTLSGFVSINGEGNEIVGKFGVDQIVDSKLPDGSDYTWKMRRDENHRSWRKTKM